MNDMHYDDFRVGQRFTSRAQALSREGIVAFAEEFDPNPAHLSEATAATSQFGELVASGWQTACVTMRLQFDAVLGHIAGGGMGAKIELNWLRPVRPGDELHVVVEVTEMRESRSRPDRGLVTFLTTTLNQDEQPVQSMLGTVMMKRRVPGQG